jgi:outer membrane murein-binding lipoprotein Lpp
MKFDEATIDVLKSDVRELRDRVVELEESLADLRSKLQAEPALRIQYEAPATEDATDAPA